MPTHYSCFQGQILRIVFYCPVCTVVKASVVSISHWLMPVKFGKECALRGSVQTRWLGRRKASGALLAQEVEEGKLISHYGRLFLDPKCSHKLSFEVCFPIWTATISQHGGPHQGPHSVLISLLQWTVPLQRIRAITHQAVHGCLPATGDSQKDHMALGLQWLNWRQRLLLLHFWWLFWSITCYAVCPCGIIYLSVLSCMQWSA